MTLYPVHAGNFKLDGGAMFGVVPKTIWNKTNPSDAKNRIDLAARCLLIEDGNRLILIDSGMGDKQSSKFFSYYAPWGPHSLDTSLKKIGFQRADITDVFLTHLHFDHCGGVVQWKADRTGYELAFKNATIWSTQNHWDWATQPNPREKASFLKENIEPILQSGQLQFVDRKASYQERSELGFGILFVDGHTEKQMIPHIAYKDKKIVFMADLLPTVGHIPLPYVMGYDIRPLETLKEKKTFLDRAATDQWFLFMQHDANHEIITVKHTEKGVRLDEQYTCNELFN